MSDAARCARNGTRATPDDDTKADYLVHQTTGVLRNQRRAHAFAEKYDNEAPRGLVMIKFYLD